MKKTAILIMLLTIVSKSIGFAREITLSYFYGASNISDAYLISLTVPAVIFFFISVGIVTCYIPMYSKISNQNGDRVADLFTSNMINFVMILCTLIVIFVYIFTEPVVKIFASGFEGETLSIAVNFTRIVVFGIYFTALVYIFSGYLQIKNNFIVPTIIGVPLNFFLILSIVLSSNINYKILPIGNVIATASQLLLLIPFAYRKGYKHKIVLNIYEDNLKEMIHLALPVIIGVSVNQINILVDRTLASQVAIGGISALNYANRLNLFIQSIFVMSLATVMYPMISKMAADNNMKGFKKTISESINGISLLVLPVTVGSMIFVTPIITILYGRGAFDANAISMTSSALFFYSIGMIGFGFREVLSRAFYSLQDTKTPMINAAIAMILNIILNFFLSKIMGISGLALATSISAIFCTGLLFISLRKKIGPFGMKNIAISLIKILCASLVMGGITKFSYNLLLSYINANISLITSISIGAIVYFVIIYFMKIEDVDIIVNALKKKLGRNVANGKNNK